MPSYLSGPAQFATPLTILVRKLNGPEALHYFTNAVAARRRIIDAAFHQLSGAALDGANSSGLETAGPRRRCLYFRPCHHFIPLGGARRRFPEC